VWNTRLSATAKRIPAVFPKFSVKPKNAHPLLVAGLIGRRIPLILSFPLF
jgi:hypothetical protein